MSPWDLLQWVAAVGVGILILTIPVMIITLGFRAAYKAYDTKKERTDDRIL